MTLLSMTTTPTMLKHVKNTLSYGMSKSYKSSKIAFKGEPLLKFAKFQFL